MRRQPWHGFVASLALIIAVVLAAQLRAEEKASEFARQTIDLGVVVSDVEASAKFYTEAIGFAEVKSFGVSADFAEDVGLTANQPLEIRVFKLGDESTATSLKLMQLPQTNPKPSDNSYIHSQLGFSYLTIHINDTNAAVARLKKAGVKPIAKGPVELPKGLPQGVYLTLVRDPDGNFIELVGPKK
ncbi:MAG: VOC family protein [Planctomycetales bacterium]|nr:VOC family protein [Planctomycetales bacterium]